jgi:hypothetical protein
MIRVSLRLSLLVVFLAALAVPASALTVVNVSAPQINYMFSTTGVVYVTDLGASLLNGGTFQSRIYQGQPGSPTAGKYVYEYRMNLRNAVGVVNIPYVTWVWLPFGPIKSYNYNGDWWGFTEQVFVTTVGGIGTIGLNSASTWGDYAFFEFASPVDCGGSPGTGESSYFWGLVSDYPPHVVTATVQTNSGTINVNAYAPTYP